MFKLDSPLMTILNKVADILILNIIFIIACVPIVTIGAAFSAAYYIGFKMVKDEESYIVRGFFKAFKDNFKQATIIWLILMVVLGVLFADFRIMAYSGIEFAAWMKVAMGAVTLFVVIGISFVFGLQARYTNTIKNTLRNSFLMALSHLPTAVLLIGVYAVPVLLAYFLPRLMPIYALLAVGGILYFQSFLLLRVFHKYEASLKKIEEEQKEEEQMEEEKIEEEQKEEEQMEEEKIEEEQKEEEQMEEEKIEEEQKEEEQMEEEKIEEEQMEEEKIEGEKIEEEQMEEEQMEEEKIEEEQKEEEQEENNSSDQAEVLK